MKWHEVRSIGRQINKSTGLEWDMSEFGGVDNHQLWVYLTDKKEEDIQKVKQYLNENRIMCNTWYSENENVLVIVL